MPFENIYISINFVNKDMFSLYIFVYNNFSMFYI